MKTQHQQKISVEVDRELCIGCGNCSAICPKVFSLDDEGISTVNQAGINSEIFAQIIDAANACPGRGIIIQNESNK